MNKPDIKKPINKKPINKKIRNILFIMVDQLRHDYLGCSGHPTIKTPNIDALAARGIKFNNCYAQSGICGPSRMSFYTGRYVNNHGSSWNQVPLNIGVWTMGDYLRGLGLNVALTGKTHMVADMDGMKRLGIDDKSIDGILASQCGFTPQIRDDGLHPSQSLDKNLAYNKYLKSRGYDGDNQCHDWAKSALGDDGEILSGWSWRNSDKPARVDTKDCETTWLTAQAIDFIKTQDQNPWCLHLSYIKPHWPYMVSKPYFDLYDKNDIKEINRNDMECDNIHPVVEQFMQHEEGQTFLKTGAREAIIPSYMALITQLDDQIGRLMVSLDKMGRLDDTLIIFTSDHGDYLGDHWLGEKELFHDASIKIPLIMVHPNTNITGESDALVEAIDLIPTFIDALGGEIPSHMLDGRSLLPFINSLTPPDDWRDIAVAELDYSHRKARLALNLEVNSCKAWMIRDLNYKYIYYQGFRPQLFDLKNDPQEIYDLGDDHDYKEICDRMKDRLFLWLATGRKIRTTLPDKDVIARTDSWKEKGVIFGEW